MSSPEGGGPPQEFPSKRARELYNRSLFHKTKDALDSILLESDTENEPGPVNKQTRGRYKKKSAAGKIITEQLEKADTVLLKQVDDFTESCVFV
jgi:hypothetical protein